MLIYRCELDNSRTLIDATSVSGGVATSNLQLFTTPYSYEIVIGNKTFREDSFTSCRVEHQTDHTFFVDTSEVDISPVVGLFLLDCSIEKAGNNTVTMRWASNEQNPTEIEGCIEAHRGTVNGLQQIYEDCTTGVTGSFTRTIPTNLNTYEVRGRITQDGITGYCKDSVSFFENPTPSQIWGPLGLLLGALLMLSMALLFAAENNQGIVGAAIGFVAAWSIGMIAMSWAKATVIISIFIVVAILARHSRKGGP